MNYTYYRRYRPSSKRSSFKSFFWLVLILVVALLILKGCVGVVSSLLKDKEDEATLTLNKGTAQVTEWGQDTPQSVADAQLLLVGDTVETGESSVVTLSFTNGTTVMLDQNSKLTFVQADLNEDADVLQVELLEGRAYVEQSPKDENQPTLQLHTDVMNIESMSASYLASNQANKEYIYGFGGQATVKFVDRSQEDSVIDTITIEKGKKSILTDETERNLLDRQSVTLMGDAGDDLMGDAFLAFVRGDSSALGTSSETDEATDESESTNEANNDESTPDESETEESTTETESTETTTPVSTLQIKVTSPGLNSTIQKSAIAIEGSIVAGTADHVTVTWSGNNSPYTLAGFKAGGSSFRYVADASYGNLKAGTNTFTVVAYTADGTVSNTVTVVINAEF
jgi:hypothetical protein